jgi:cell wall-associated NlpC family hydrolase
MLPGRRRQLLAAGLTAFSLLGSALAATHTVAAGETLYRIAAMYGTTVQELQALNKMTGTDLKVGQVLIVPDAAPAKVAILSTSVKAPEAPRSHTVAKGETLYRIAVAYGVTLDALREANGLSSDALQPGQVLSLPGSTRAAEPESRPAEASLPKPSAPTPSTPATQGPAAPEGLKVPPLGSWTPAPANIAKSPVPAAALPDLAVAAPAATDTGRLVLHTVSKGENLYRIGLRYGVSANAVAAANNLTDDQIALGQTLRIPTTATVPSLPASGGSDLLATARRYLGVAYRYGGTTPSGLDCSGFTLVVMAELGVKLPRTSGEQYNTGAPVARENLQRGDLVFFDTAGRGSVSHVGIYLGDNRFIHAATFPPMVTESGLDEQYYATRYLGARRVMPSAPVNASAEAKSARP